MSGLPAALALLLLAGPPRDAPKQKAPATLAPPPAHLADDARCEACHTTARWSEVVFPHARTGFLLENRHADVSCRACHPSGFSKAVPRTCAGCHRDAHSGKLGNGCEGCHDTSSWAATFSVEQHRLTNFPLSGRHGAVSCRECHPISADRTFVRPTSDCVDCHGADYARADAAGVPHSALGFGQACRQCHDTWRFRGARYAAHEACFPISRGPHAVPCQSCHRSLPIGFTAGSCATGTPACTGCHGKEKTDAQHPGNLGYRYLDGDCVQCHRASRP